MKKLLVASVLFFILCLPAMAADGDQFDGRFGVNAGYFFFDNPAIDDNCWFAGIEYAADMWSVELDYTTPDAVVGGSTEQFMMVHLDYLYYFSGEGYQMENPTYAGVGYSHRFSGDVVDDGGGFNVMVGMDFQENWNFEAKYVNFGSDDTLWGLSVGWFFNQ